MESKCTKAEERKAFYKCNLQSTISPVPSFMETILFLHHVKIGEEWLIFFIQLLWCITFGLEFVLCSTFRVH